MRLDALLRRIGIRPKKENERSAPSQEFLDLAEREFAESGLPYDHRNVVFRAQHLEATEAWPEGRE